MAWSQLINELIQQCNSRQGSIVFAEGDDDRILQAASILATSNVFSKIGLIGSTKVIESKIKSTVTASAASCFEYIERDSAEVIGLTKKTFSMHVEAKGRKLDLSQLNEVCIDPLYQAGALVSSGQYDCAVAGAVAPTAKVIKAALYTVGPAKTVKTVSGSFVMERTDQSSRQLYCYADCGVVIDPSIDQLVDIAYSTCMTYQQLTRCPAVAAFLSFSTKGSAKHAFSEKTEAAQATFKQRYPQIISDGELQFDAAIVESIGRRKAPASPVPGKANVFIFPDLNAGNIAYKITERLGGFRAYGPILQGLAKPYSDLSRGATAEDIAASAIINLVRSQNNQTITI